MNIYISGHQIDLDDDVKSYAESKIQKLEKYGLNIIGAELTLEKNENKTHPEAATANLVLKIAKMANIDAHGEGSTLYAAIDEAERKASRQIKKLKDKKENKSRIAKTKRALKKIRFLR